MDECKACGSDHEFYIYYIHGWLLPHFELLRAQKKLRRGRLYNMEIEGQRYNYTGEIDQDNKACGFGEAVNNNGTWISGTFFDN